MDGEDEEHFMQDTIIRAKWTLDGCATLGQVSHALMDQAAHYERLVAEGWELTGPVDDDYGFIRKQEGSMASAGTIFIKRRGRSRGPSHMAVLRDVLLLTAAAAVPLMLLGAAGFWVLS